MPRNGSGTYTLPQAPFVPGTTISSSAVNSDFSDIATALTQSVSTDGQTPMIGSLRFPPGSAANPSVTFNTDNSSGMYSPGAGIVGIAAGSSAGVVVNSTVENTGNGNILQYGNGAFINPVGSVIDFAGSTAPTGWFLCYGEAISRTAYPELFTVIGTTYGSGNGTSTFNLPDLRGRGTYGKDNMGGTTAGRITSAGTNFDATLLGNAGGGQRQILAQANLPTVSFPVTGTFTGTGSGVIGAGNFSHNHTYLEAIQTGHGGGSGAQFDTYTTGISSTYNSPAVGVSVSVSGSIFGAAPTGGTDAPFSTLSPAFILNKIIFAGRP